MHIEKLILENVGPHKHLEVSFVKGLNGIIGANGAGKSTIVNAIYAALTNDFDRLGKTKKDVVHFDTDEPSFIQLEGTHQNKPFVLKRAIQPNSGTIFSIGDLSYIKGDVNEAISQHLNVSQAIIDNYVFVDQWQMFQFLSQTPAERAKAFQYLCGTEAVTNIHKACNTFVSKKGITTVVDNRETLQLNIDDLKQQLGVNSLETKQKENELLSEGELEQAQRTIKLYEEKIRIKKEIKQQKAAIGEAETDVAKLKANRQIKNQRLLVISKRLDSLAVMEDAAKTTVIQHDNIVRATNELEAFRNKHLALTKELTAKESYIEELLATSADLNFYLDKEQFDLLKQENQKLQFKVQNLKHITKGIKGKSKCPTCSQAIDESYIDKLESRYNKYTEQLNEHSEKLDAVVSYSNQLRTVEDDVARTKANLAKYEDKITTTETLLSTYTSGDMPVARAKKVIALLRKLRLKHKSVTDDLTSVTGDITFVLNAIKERKLKLAENRAAACLSVSKFDFMAARDKLDQHNLTLIDYKALRLSRKTIKSALETTTNTLVELEQALAKNLKIQNLTNVVSKVADVFHWNSLPKLVSQKNLELVVSDINNNLALFDNPFYVEADEDLNFKIFIPTAGGFFPVKSKQLSGGQKVILAIAFRLAVDKVFGNDVGMLFLDEPTSGLDEDNINYFHNALTLLSNSNSGRQIVIITHVQGFNSVYDNVIEVAK